MFKAGTVTSLTSAQSLVKDTQKDVNKEGTTDYKERNNIARKLNGAHHKVPTSRNPNFTLFAHIFFDSV
jgi:hypothetical protein